MTDSNKTELQQQSGLVERISWPLLLDKLLCVCPFISCLITPIEWFDHSFVPLLLIRRITVRPALSRKFWTGVDTSNTVASSYMRPSKPGSMPISDSSHHDAFDMAKMKRHSPGHYKVSISTRAMEADSDSTERIYDGGITVNTHVDVKSEVANNV